MTQPDGFNPDESFSPISNLAAKTQEDWESELLGQTSSPFEGILAGLFDGLPSGMPLPLAILTVLGRAILKAPAMVWNSISELLDDVPILGDIIDIINDILSFLGIGGSDGAGSGGFDPIGAILDFINGILQPGGVTTGNTPVPPHQLGALAPGTSENDLPDTFTNPSVLQGQGRWVVEPHGVVRTVRPGILTVFYLIGTIDSTAYSLADATATIRTGENEQWKLSTPLDLDNLEVVFITFTENNLLDMGPGRRDGVAKLRAAVKALPPGQKFAFFGFSEAAAVCSDIYDELRHGNLQSRREDLVAAVMLGNPRRETGVTFTDPTYGLCPDPAPDTGGVSPTRLENTESFWWEMAIADDPITVVSNTTEVGQHMRDYYKTVQEGGFGVFTAALGLMFPILIPPEAKTALDTLLAIGEPENGHNQYNVEKPFGAQGDTRHYLQVAVDYFNSVAANLTPPPAELHQLLGVPYPVEPGEPVTIAADVMWHNFPAYNGPSLMLVANCYDAQGEHIASVINEDAAKSNVAVSSYWAWEEMAGVFQMPVGAATVRPMIQVAEQVMSTGVAWFTEPVLQAQQKVDAATLGNMSNLPIVPATNVAGSHGLFDLNATLETIVNGLGSANQQDNLNDVSLSDLFAMMQQTAQNAQTALDLVAELQDPSFHLPSEEVYATPGSHEFTIPGWAQTSGVLFDLIAIGGGRGGNASVILPGWGGEAGKWGGGTLTYGTEIPLGTTKLMVTVGAGGASATAGGDTIWSLPNTTPLVVGQGGSAATSDSSDGQSANNFQQGTRAYFGGGRVAVGKPGALPGGGGGGGGFGLADGGKGGNGRAWIVVRQPA